MNELIKQVCTDNTWIQLPEWVETDVIYNERTLEIAASKTTIHLFKYLVGGEVVAVIPTYENALGEYSFIGHFFVPYVRMGWICKDPKYLVMMFLDARARGELLDIVDLADEDRDLPAVFPDDNGVAVIEVDSLESLLGGRSASFRKNMQRMLRNAEAQSLTYSPVNFVSAYAFIQSWFRRFDNPFLAEITELYLHWVTKDAMLINGIFLKGQLVGADFLLFDGKYCHGLLTPWDRDNRELYSLQVGHFAMAKAVEFLREEGKEEFSIGSREFMYKRNWETKVLPTRVMGLGRWETRDSGSS